MKKIILAILVSANLEAAAQDLPLRTQQQLEQLAEATDREPDDDALLLQLATWRRRPLNLNAADAADLQIFPFLTPLQIAQFFKYKSLLGSLTDVHELQAIPTWDVATIRLILPYVTVATPLPALRQLKKLAIDGDHYFLLRNSRTLQRARGYGAENGFLGDRNQLLTRYRYQHPDGLQYGLTAEKDAGEFMNLKTLAPFLSMHLFARRLGSIKAFALGDFTVNMGQGLVHWQSLAFGKGPEVLAIKRQSPVLRPYTSAGEALFMRGAGITLKRGLWETTLFAALQQVAANLKQDSVGISTISSLSISGLHRTASELVDRKAVGQQSVGFNGVYRNGNGHIGVNAVGYRFSSPIQKRDEPYNLFAPAGKNFFNASADYDYTWRNAHFFGEWATDRLGNTAWVQGLLVSAHPKVDFALHARNIHRAYSSIASSAFTESSATVNEQGMYAGAQVRPSSKLTVSAYADVFRSPWLRFRADAPTAGNDYLLQIQYRWNKGSQGYLRWRSEGKEENESSVGNALRFLEQRSRKSIRAYGYHTVSERLILRSQAEAVWYQKGALRERGWLFFADAQLRPQRRWSADLRLVMFDTDGFNSRAYTYENDVLYAFSVPALWGKGARGYALFRYKPTKHLSFWGRLAHTIYTDRKIIGSGMDAIEGNSRTDIRMQAVIEW